MIAYVQKIVTDLVPRLRWRRPAEFASVAERFEVLAEEINRLDPRDFVVADQFEFLEGRLEVRRLAKMRQADWDELVEWLTGAVDDQGSFNARLRALDQSGTGASATQGAREPSELEQQLRITVKNAAEFRESFDAAIEICERIGGVLNSYAGQGSKAVTRSFSFVADSKLRTIIERDYKELTLTLLAGFAWKSAVVMAGSILEAILHDLLTRDPPRVAQATGSSMAPKKRGGLVKDITSEASEDEWKLADYIKVAVDLSLLPTERADTIDQVLRDYRNFVHPRKEIKYNYPCTEAEATLAKGALDAVCNHLS